MGLKNCDTKIITGANVKQFSRAVSDNAVAIQRGFVGGRQHVLNIVDLDAITRAHANYNFFKGEAILALWDFLAAFPSVRHRWILDVCKAYGFPPAFFILLRSPFAF